MSEQGVPSELLVGEDHMQVRAPLVRLLGANGALVWTRIDYRVKHVAYAHEHAGRMWWEVSSKDLGAEVGLGPDAVDRAIAKLVEGGQLLAEQHSLPMQTRSYSPVIFQSAESRNGAEDLRDIADSIPRDRGLQSANSRLAVRGIADSSSTQEREDVEDLSSSAADGADSDSQYTVEIRELCDRIAEMVRANGHKVGTVGKSWWVPVEQMVRLDDVTLEQVEIVARWATSDPFWSSNIRSTATLRKRLSTLRAQRNAELLRRKPSTVEHGRTVDQILREREVSEQKAIAS